MQPSEVGERLVAAVRAAPGDDVAWQLYADWLQEQGDWRGEALALHLQLQAAPPEERRALERRYAERYPPERCLDGLPRKHWEHLGIAVWRGGFATAVTLHGAVGVRALAALCAHPAGRLLSKVTVRGLRDDIAPLVEALALAQPAALDLRESQLGPDGARTLAASRPLVRLESLALSRNTFGDEGAMALAASSALPRLAQLDLRTNAIGPEGAHALAASTALAQRTSIDLGGNDIGDAGRAAIAASPRGGRVLL